MAGLGAAIGVPKRGNVPAEGHGRLRAGHDVGTTGAIRFAVRVLPWSQRRSARAFPRWRRGTALPRWA